MQTRETIGNARPAMSNADAEQHDPVPLLSPRGLPCVHRWISIVGNASRPHPPPTANTTTHSTIGNLSYRIEREQVKQFFEEAGEVVDVRLSTFKDGSFKGYGHVEFATAEAAQKALGFANPDLMGRPVWVELALERGAYTSGSGRHNSSFKSAPRSTVYIEGFDTSIGEDQIRRALLEHFGSCGEITRVSIPKDYETGACKGIAFMDFKDPDSLDKAYELNASELGGYLLYVDQAKRRPDNNRDGGFRGDRRGSFGGGRGCGFGGRGDR